MAGSSLLGALRVTLGLDSAAFSKGTKRATNDMTKMQKGISSATNLIKAGFASVIGAGALTMFSEASKRGLELASSLGETAQQLGVNTAALQEYRYAASQAGVAQEEMDNALSKGTKVLGEAAAGAKKPAAMYEKLGISIRDAKGQVRNFGDIIPEIAQAISKLPTPAEKAAAATALLGKSGQKLLPLLNEGKAGVDAYREAAHKLGIVLTDEMIAKADEAADKMGTLNQVMEAQEAVFATENADAILKYNEALNYLKLKMVEVVGAAASFFSELRRGYDIFAENLRSLEGSKNQYNDQILIWERMANTYRSVTSAISNFTSQSVANISAMVTGVRNWISGVLSKVWDGAIAKIESVKKMFFGLYDAVVGNSYVPDMVDGIQTEMARLDGVMVNPADKATKSTAEKFRDMAGSIRDLLSELFPELDAFAEYQRKLDLLNKSNLDDKTKAEGRRRLFDKYNPQTQAPDEGPQTVVDMDAVESDSFEKADDMIDDYLDQWEKATKRGIRTNEAYADSFVEMTRDISGSLQNLIGAIKGGSFLDILDSVLGAVDSIARAFGGFKIGGMEFGSPGPTTRPPGFANGGSMRIGGFGGIDRNMLSMNGQPIARVSRGEDLTITPQNAGGRAGGLQVQVIENERYWVKVQETAGRVVDQRAPNIAAAGAKLANGRAQFRNSRALA